LPPDGRRAANLFSLERFSVAVCGAHGVYLCEKRSNS
jgi:hypothetical protein